MNLANSIDVNSTAAEEQYRELTLLASEIGKIISAIEASNN